MNGDDRLALERIVVSCALDSDDCLMVALEELPPEPFRSFEDLELTRIFYWAAGMWQAGAYDGIRNRDVLLAAMVKKQWPEGWLDFEREGFLEFTLAWTPLIYEPSAVRSICKELVRDAEAYDQLIATRSAFRANHVVQRALGAAPDAPSRVRPGGAVHTGMRIVDR